MIFSETHMNIHRVGRVSRGAGRVLSLNPFTLKIYIMQLRKKNTYRLRWYNHLRCQKKKVKKESQTILLFLPYVFRWIWMEYQLYLWVWMQRNCLQILLCIQSKWFQIWSLNLHGKHLLSNPSGSSLPSISPLKSDTNWYVGKQCRNCLILHPYTIFDM